MAATYPRHCRRLLPLPVQMNILILHNLHPLHPSAGGGQRVTADCAGALAAHGHTVHVVYLGDRSGEPPPGCVPHWVEPSRRLLGSAQRLGREARRVIRAHAVQAVFASSPESAGVTFGPAVPGLVAMSHHPWVPDLRSAPGWSRPVLRLQWLREQQRFILERRLLRQSRIVLSPSQSGLDSLRENGFTAPNQDLRVLPNGVDDAWFELGPQAEPVSSRAVFVGRLEHQKGLDVLVAALAEVPGQELDLIGDGPDRSALERCARELGVADRIHFVGALPPPQLRERLRGARYLVLPSRWELFGVVLAEAQSLGVPTIASRVGGIPEVVDEGRSGLLVPAEDVAGLASAMRSLKESDALWARLREGAIERAESFRWSTLAARYEAVLEEATAR